MRYLLTSKLSLIFDKHDGHVKIIKSNGRFGKILMQIKVIELFNIIKELHHLITSH
jgi:hypothetical protein